MSHEPQELRSTRTARIRTRFGMKTRRPGATDDSEARTQGALVSREIRMRPWITRHFAERGQTTNCFVLKRALQHLLFDIAVGLVWALLLAAAIIFMSGVSQFIYVDF